MDSIEVQKKIKEIDTYITLKLPKQRYEHSVRVAKMAYNFCKQFSVCQQEGYLAGLAHDMCKVEKDSYLLTHAQIDNSQISDIEYKKPSLLHGRVAAILLAQDFKITNTSILNAVKHHTFGSPDMDDLGKIIFVSDKLEPGRKNLEEKFRQKALSLDLDDMVLFVLENNIAYLKRRGKHVSPITELTLIRLKNKERFHEKL